MSEWATATQASHIPHPQSRNNTSATKTSRITGTRESLCSKKVTKDLRAANETFGLSLKDAGIGLALASSLTKPLPFVENQLCAEHWADELTCVRTPNPVKEPERSVLCHLLQMRKMKLERFHPPSQVLGLNLCPAPEPGN